MLKKQHVVTRIIPVKTTDGKKPGERIRQLYALNKGNCPSVLNNAGGFWFLEEYNYEKRTNARSCNAAGFN